MSVEGSPVSPRAWLLAGSALFVAGVIGVLVEVHVVPYPALFGLDPGRIPSALQDPGLRLQYVLHFAAMVVAALAALPGSYVLSRLLRPVLGRLAPVAFALTALGLVAFAYGSALNVAVFPRLALDVERGALGYFEAIHTGNAVNDHTIRVVGAAGMAFLGGVALLSVGLWRSPLFPRWLGAFGLLGVGLLLTQATLIYTNRMPFIWGVTVPPPPEYLLSLWFVFVGLAVVRRARVLPSTFPESY